MVLYLQIKWMKDRVEIRPGVDSNFIQAADGHLIIIQARETETGNYTCVAENVASTRLSPPAKLQVVGELVVARTELIMTLNAMQVCLLL